jgi:hypothetical protein
MTWLLHTIRRGTRFLLCDPAAVGVLVASFIVAGVVLVLTDYTINDEGMLTYYWASWLRRDFVPMLYFQKSKPVLCALYAPVTVWGPRVTLIAHVLVAATAIAMLAAVARSLTFRLPNLPAFVLAVSPLYFFGSAAGLSNVDGVVGIVLVLYLLCVRRWPMAAGLVLGMLPWVRFELAVFCAVMALYALATRGQRSLLLTMAVFPLVYAATGALYHSDILWFVHFPPAAPFDPADPLYVTPTQLLGFRYLLEPTAALTPAAALAAALPLGRLQRIERAVLLYAVLVVLIMNILPVLHIGNFGTSPRYMLHLLPALALLIGRALEPLWEDARPSPGMLLVAAAAAAWVATRQMDSRATFILIAVYALVWAVAWLRAGRFAVIAVVGLLLAGPFMPLRTDVGPPRYLAPMLAWLQSHPERWGDPIYTNAQLLAQYLERRLPGVDVHYMLGEDMAYETKFLINAGNGQLERIGKLSAAEFYGRQILPPFLPESFPSNALFVLRVDQHRLNQLLPPENWSERLEVIEDTANYRIARLR